MRRRPFFYCLAWLAIFAGAIGLSRAQRGGTSVAPTVPATANRIDVQTSVPTGSCTATPLVIKMTPGAVSYCCDSGAWAICGAADNPLGLPSNPSPCTTGLYVTDQDASGTLTCAQPSFSQISGAPTDAQIPDTITVNRTEARAISLDAPTSSEDVTIWRTPFAITVTRLDCVVTTGSATYTIRYATDRSAAGFQVVGGGTPCTSTTTGSSNTGLTVAVPSGSWIWLETTASTTPANMDVTVTYTVP